MPNLTPGLLDSVTDSDRTACFFRLVLFIFFNPLFSEKSVTEKYAFFGLDCWSAWAGVLMSPNTLNIRYHNT